MIGGDGLWSMYLHDRWTLQSNRQSRGFTVHYYCIYQLDQHCCRVVAVIEYIKNQTHSIYLDTESIVQHIVDLIEGNMNVFEEIYTMQNVRSGEERIAELAS